jgi:hypothetical protein
MNIFGGQEGAKTHFLCLPQANPGGQKCPDGTNSETSLANRYVPWLVKDHPTKTGK